MTEPMRTHDNLVSTLDKFQTAVYLKDMHGHYLSMNRAGIELMNGNHGRVLGKTTHELFDTASASRMIASDQLVMKKGQIHTNAFTATDRKTGLLMPMFNAKTAVVSRHGEALGILGISILNANDHQLFGDLCKLLPQFIKLKHLQLVNELMELRTVSEFLKFHQLH